MSHCVSLLVNLFINAIGNSFKNYDLLIYADDFLRGMLIVYVMVCRKQIKSKYSWVVQSFFFQNQQNIISSYQIDNKVLRSVPSIKGLGCYNGRTIDILIRSQLNPQSKILIRLLTRNCKLFSVASIKMVYFLSLLDSHLE